jgi:hypothetical protein
MRGETAGEDTEFGGLKFKHHGLGNAGFFAGGDPHLFCETADHRLCFVEEDVTLEGVFSGDGLGGAVRLDGAVIDAAGQFIEAHPVTAKPLLEGGGIESTNIADGSHIHRCQVTSCDFADARQALDRKRREEIDNVGWLDDEQAVGLTPVRGNFGEELAGSNAG